MKNITEEQFEAYKQTFLEAITSIVEKAQTSAAFEDFINKTESDNQHNKRELDYFVELRTYFSDQIWEIEDSIFDIAEDTIRGFN